MNSAFIFASSLFFLWIIRDSFFWLKLWQDSEYRLDRFIEHIQRKKQKFFHPTYSLIYIKLFLFLAFFYAITNEDILSSYQYIIAILYVVQVFVVVKEIYQNTLKKPVLTLKVTILLFLTLSTVFLLFSLPLLDKFFWLLFVDLFLGFIVAFFVFLLSFPTELYADIQIEKALKKIRSYRNLIVIGVTGSYGKSITKEFIAYVLSEKFKVVKTHGYDNTAIGIAHTINQRLEADAEVFVVEMSAYKRGEIAGLCNFVRPKIRVLTAINNQHLTLFRTFENIKKTNYELLESLPKNGLAIINGDNRHSFDLAQKTKKEKILYKYSPNTKRIVGAKDGEIIAFNLRHRSRYTSFDIQTRATVMHFTIHAHHQIENLLPGIYIAHILGVKEKDIKKILASFK